MSTDNVRYFQIAGLTIEITGIPFDRTPPKPVIELFRLEVPGSDAIQVRHHIGLPNLDFINPTNLIYRKVPWEIHHYNSKWIYITIPAHQNDPYLRMMAIFSDDYSSGDIYYSDESIFQSENIHSLSLIPSDQILLAQVLAYHKACYLHACGIIIQGQGLACVGHSEAGKTTTARMLQGEGELLCDDRIIVRRWPEGFRVHGTWSHGDIPEVSSGSAPLRALFLLEQAPENRLERLAPRQVVRSLPEFVIKPLVTRDWWEMVLDTIEALAREVPVYRLRLEKSGAVKYLLREFLNNPNS